MRAPILDQPPIAVADGHVEKVDRYHGDNRPIRTGDIAQGKQRVGDRDIGLDEADPVVGERLSLPKMLSGANAFEISDIERMNIGACRDVTMLHALWLPEISIRQGSGIPGVSVFVSDRECENSVTASAGDREQGIG